MDNNSLNQFLQKNTARDYTQTNKNINGLVYMKSFKDSDTDSSAINQFRATINNIKEVKQ